MTLSAGWMKGYDIARDVLVDGLARGHILAPRGYSATFAHWAAITNGSYRYVDHLPDLDHAVMWVLRRAAPKVWREERGPVWRVVPMWPTSAFASAPTERPKRPATRWLVEPPAHALGMETFREWLPALMYADRRASEEVAP